MNLSRCTVDPREAVKSFHEMTADEIAAHRAAWKRGEAEIWRCTTARRSNVDPRREVFSDHDAPTAGLCALAASRAFAEQLGGRVVVQPRSVICEAPGKIVFDGTGAP